MKHSPAPWNMVRHGKYEHAINSDEWDELATVATRMFGDDEDDVEGMANARLIASAPELLEALRCAIAILEDVEAGGILIERFKQIIAKAEGA